jgi:hypothetical protein
MKTPVLFKTFNYSIGPSAVVAGSKLTRNQLVNNHADNQLSLVNIFIDFEQEDFRLEGDWQYIMASNQHAEKNWFACHQQRIHIEASIYPGLAIDLSDDSNDGLVFMIEGTIKDKDTTDACSGLLILDKIAINNEASACKWSISFYLYDSAHDDCEIAFRFPVYDRHEKDLMN